MADVDSKAWSSFMDLPSGAMMHRSSYPSLRAPLAGYPSNGSGHLADIAAYGTATQTPFATSGGAAGGGYPYSMTSRGSGNIYGLPSPPSRGGGAAVTSSCVGQQLSFDSYYNMSTAGAGLHLASAAAAAAAVRSGASSLVHFFIYCIDLKQ